MVFTIVDDITTIIDNAKLLFTETFSFLPSELYSLFLIVIGIAVVVFLYRLVR